jgi:hypothetical protein
LFWYFPVRSGGSHGPFVPESNDVVHAPTARGREGGKEIMRACLVD